MLLVRDPWWLFAYWEITPRREEEVLALMRSRGISRDKTVLRVLDITDATADHPNSFFDIELNVPADNWYVDVGVPNREWAAELGFRSSAGQFFALIRSNSVKTPPYGVSDVLDEEWMLPEEVFYQIFGLSGGRDSQRGSMDLRRMLEKYLRVAVSSQNSPRLSKKAKRSSPSAF